MVHRARLLQTAVLLLIVVVVLSVLAGGDGGVVIGAKVTMTIDQPRRGTGRARRAAATGNERTKARRPFLFRSDHNDDFYCHYYHYFCCSEHNINIKKYIIEN